MPLGEGGDGKMAGCKIDLSKFFDTIRTEASTAILERLGAPQQLVALLRRTAGEQVRWIDTEGFTHKNHKGGERSHCWMPDVHVTDGSHHGLLGRGHARHRRKGGCVRR